MKLAQWVDEVKAIGGVPDTCPDTLAAMRAASTPYADWAKAAATSKSGPCCA